MKRYRFPLEALLRMRELKERRIKQEIGGIVSEITEHKKKIDELRKKIDFCHTSHEEFVQTGITAKMLSFFPASMRSYRWQIEESESAIAALETVYRDKVRELSSAIGEVKVVEKMKEQGLRLFAKKTDKKRQNDIEELLQHREKK